MGRSYKKIKNQLSIDGWFFVAIKTRFDRGKENNKMEELMTKIKDVYADCTTCQEIAEVYAKIMMENQKQMELQVDCLVNSDIE